MAGRTWRDLQKKQPQQPRAASTPNLARPDNQAVLNQVRQQSSRLNQLMQQRQALQQKMDTLVSGSEAMDPRDAARFQVPTFAQRQAQQREWEAQRDAIQQRTQQIHQQNRSNNAQTSPPAQRPPQQPSEVSQWLMQRDQQRQENGPAGSVNQWLTRRDQDRQRLREAANERLAPLNQAADSVRSAARPLRDFNDRLEQLDSTLAREGLDAERDELRQLSNRMGADKLKQANQQVERFAGMLEKPKRAVEKIDQEWQRRQNQINGAMDKFGPYVEMAKRRLSTDKGGSGDLFERMQRNRQRALTRRQERREQERQDEQRRERALRNRRERINS
jgi:hypothetical protein